MSRAGGLKPLPRCGAKAASERKIPGPQRGVIRASSFVGDTPAPRSFSMEAGKDDEHMRVLEARRQGRFHVHVQINVESGGPIVFMRAKRNRMARRADSDRVMRGEGDDLGREHDYKRKRSIFHDCEYHIVLVGTEH
jgi:hypothetical protein